MGEVVRAVGAEAGTIWFYNKDGDGRIHPSFWIGSADLTDVENARLILVVIFESRQCECE